MQRTKKITAFVLAIALYVGMLPTLGVNAKAADTCKHMDVLFTHDTHSHLNSFSTIVDGKQEEVGGFARLKTLIDKQMCIRDRYRTYTFRSNASKRSGAG